MLIALSADKQRTHILDAARSAQYFCPSCKAPLIQKRGKIRVPHFAHAPRYQCCDDWYYDMTEWHLEWQNRFPKDTQEIVISHNGKTHRADVCIGTRIIEFQNSPISYDEFHARNLFYTSAGYDLIWVFNLIEEYQNAQISPRDNSNNAYMWLYHKQALDQFDPKNPKITLYFQFEESDTDDPDEPLLARVSWVSPRGFKWFCVDDNSWHSPQEFVDEYSHPSKTPPPLPITNPLPTTNPRQGKTLPELWKATPRIHVGRFVNLTTGYEVQLGQDPGLMAKKYAGKVYGKIKSPSGSYSKDSYEIYYWDSPVWELRWHA